MPLDTFTFVCFCDDRYEIGRQTHNLECISTESLCIIAIGAKIALVYSVLEISLRTQKEYSIAP